MRLPTAPVLKPISQRTNNTTKIVHNILFVLQFKLRVQSAFALPLAKGYGNDYAIVPRVSSETRRYSFFAIFNTLFVSRLE